MNKGQKTAGKIPKQNKMAVQKAAIEQSIAVGKKAASKQDKTVGKKAVDYCIKNGILADFLSKNRAEAIAVSIFEYDEARHMKSERETAYRKGIERGREQGIQALIEMSIEFGGSKQWNAL